MSYSSRHRYKSRREKNQQNWVRLKYFVGFGLLAGFLLFWFNRVSIINYMKTYFY